ncbi:MAG: cytosine deaminase [Phormidesmis priestleyi]|uniref:Cytosine deaminase n=1 Tax=Phormidesmis priestleyi TaxID=268141 RepID=A0A2W4X2E4_9CYAN|nr:MAG: cytosine deaminase [Phormidesmis priestleyi]
MDATLLLRGAQLIDREGLVDIAIADDRIVAIAPDLRMVAVTEWDLGGQLVSAPFVESHIHLDSALTAGEPRWNRSGTLFEGIEIWRDRKQQLTMADVKNRAVQALKQQASYGVLYVRSHADVSERSLTALKGLLEVREAVKDWMTLQVVAFPQDGLYGSEKNEALMEEALKLGADVVGGIPHYEMTREDGVRSVEKIFELAQRYDRLIDVHCDEIDDPQSRFLEVMAACSIRSGMKHRVTASHTTAFGSYDDAYALKLMGFLKRSHINFTANPLINITLQGRTDTYPKRRGVTRVKELWQNGLNVSLGHDCIQDPWYSLGTGNLLAVAEMAVHVCQMTGMEEIEACFEMVTAGGAKTLNVTDEYGIEVGKPANLIVLDAQSPYEAILKRATVKAVISRGQVLVETIPPVVRWANQMGQSKEPVTRAERS